MQGISMVLNFLICVSCYAGHATLMKSVLKPGYEFDQLLVLGTLQSLAMNSLTFSNILNFFPKTKKKHFYHVVSRGLFSAKKWKYENLTTLLDWLFALQNKSFPSFFDFLDSCNFCFWFVVPLFTPCVLGCWYQYILLIKKKKKNENLTFSLFWAIQNEYSK